MKRKLVVVATVVVLVAAGAVVFGSGLQQRTRATPLSSATSAHGNGMDHAMSAVLAMYSAPVGATPCESAYNAFKASLDYSTENKVTPVVLRVAPRDEFLQRCGAFPAAVQSCLIPVYLSHHRPECDKVKPPTEDLKPLVEMRAASDPGAPRPEGDLDTPPGGPF